MVKILIIDDDKAFAETLTKFLSSTYPDVRFALGGEEGIKLVYKILPDIVITDLKMPGMDGFEVLKRIKNFDNSIAVLMITAFTETEQIIRAMQLGAYDYFEKSYDLERIKLVVQKTFESKKVTDRLIVTLNENYEEYRERHFMIGETFQMKEIFKKIGKVSATKINVLVEGESGTGKELITRMIHFGGVTKKEPFIAVNCSALSESLLESEIFGHVQGAFTGATRNKKGKFELAGEGTIFLDEISEISPALQVKLLRVIQEREFEKVGGEDTIRMKARIVAATNKNLLKLVESGKFREDLFYRLNIFTIHVPPLRERKEEIPKLVVHFLRKINMELHKSVNIVPFNVLELLKSYDWPGNIRELENTLMHSVLMAKGNVLEEEYINFIQKNSQKETYSFELISLAEVEKRHIQLVLEKVKWNKNKASKILGITKTTLYNKIAHYNLSPSQTNDQIN